MCERCSPNYDCERHCQERQRFGKKTNPSNSANGFRRRYRELDSRMLFLTVHSWMMALHSEPRFRALVAKMVLVPRDQNSQGLHRLFFFVAFPPDGKMQAGQNCS